MSRLMVGFWLINQQTFFLFFLMLEIKPRVSCRLGLYEHLQPNTEALPQGPLWYIYNLRHCLTSIRHKEHPWINDLSHLCASFRDHSLLILCLALFFTSPQNPLPKAPSVCLLTGYGFLKGLFPSLPGPNLGGVCLHLPLGQLSRQGLSHHKS